MVAMTLLNRGSSKGKKEDDALKGMTIHNLIYVASSIGHELTLRAPQLVCLEDYSGGAGPNASILAQTGEVTGAAKLWMHQGGVRWFEIAATSLKKYVTGSGKGKKEVVWLGAYKRWGVDQSVIGDDNNVLDAYCLARAALAILWREEDPSTMTQVDRVALSKIRVGGSSQSKAKKTKGSEE